MPQKRNKNIFKVFGNQERVQLLCCLAKPQSVTELLEKCTLSQSALSQHLLILKEANLVTCTRDGKRQIYSIINTEMLAIAKKLIAY